MRNLMRVLALAAASVALPVIGGCSAFGGGDDHHDHYSSRSDGRYEGRYDGRDSAQQAGDRNTRISDKVDDGRINGRIIAYAKELKPNDPEHYDQDAHHNG